MIFVICTAVCIILEQAYGGMSIMTEAISGLGTMDFSNPVTGMFSILTGVWGLIKAFFKFLTWDYYFFTGYWVWARFLLMSISLGVAISLALTLIRGSSSN